MEVQLLEEIHQQHNALADSHAIWNDFDTQAIDIPIKQLPAVSDMFIHIINLLFQFPKRSINLKQSKNICQQITHKLFNSNV